MAQSMTIEKKLDTVMEAIKLEKDGDNEASSRLIRSIPMPPYLAKIYKEKVGAEHLVNSGWNLSEAEAEFGSDWLNK